MAQLRRQLRSCDAVAIAATEYAAGVGGSMKNALDWLVGDSMIYRKVIGVASAGTTGGHHAIEQMIRTTSWQGGATTDDIASWIDTIIRTAARSTDDRRESVAATLSRRAIDMDRFGSFE